MKYIKHFETIAEVRSFFDNPNRDAPIVAITDEDKIIRNNGNVTLTWYNEYNTIYFDLQ